jgi:FKBP-type peptidyl-prolyl cis-trans isomerase 2
MPRALRARRALGLVLLAASCRRHDAVRAGDTVVLRYELSADGAVVESDFDGEPATVVQGAGQVPPGADAALLGMAPGEEKRLVLPPEDAFGPYDPARVEVMPLSRLGALAKGLVPGRKVMGVRDGKAETARVVAVEDGRATLDFNPPLAGKTVQYRVRVLSIGVGP